MPAHGVKPSDNPFLDVGARDVEAKPCCARIKNADGLIRWCLKSDGHTGDHVGVSRGEWPADITLLEPITPRTRPRWSKKHG